MKKRKKEKTERKNKLPIIFWDSCIFLAWLNQEPDKDLIAIEYYLRLSANGKIELGCSTISRAEVLFLIRNDRKKQDQWRKILDDPGIREVNVREDIAERAVELRDAVHRRGGKLSLADALIIASAELIGAKELQSYDSDLIQLNGQGIVALPIQPPPPPPPPPQPVLPIESGP